MTTNLKFSSLFSQSHAQIYVKIQIQFENCRKLLTVVEMTVIQFSLISDPLYFTPVNLSKLPYLAVIKRL